MKKLTSQETSKVTALKVDWDSAWAEACPVAYVTIPEGFKSVAEIAADSNKGIAAANAKALTSHRAGKWERILARPPGAARPCYYYRPIIKPRQ